MDAFDIGSVMGLVVGEGYFGGHTTWGPHLTIGLHTRDPEPRRHDQRLLGGAIYGPYEHNGRVFRCYMLRGKALRAAAVRAALTRLPQAPPVRGLGDPLVASTFVSRRTFIYIPRPVGAEKPFGNAPVEYNFFVQHALTARRQAPPNGVIETLSAGYLAINRQLWLLLVPVLVDLLLWLGPHVSYSPLVDPAVTHATEWARQATPPTRRTDTDPQLASDLEDLRQWLMTRTSDTNALALVAHGPLGLPSLSGGLAASGGLTFVTGWTEGLLLLLACFLASLLLGGGFYTGIASASTGARAGPLAVSRRAPRAAVRVLGLLGTAVGVSVLLGLPLALLVGFTAVVAPAVALLGIALLLAAAMATLVYLSFAVPAIFVSNVGPLAAIQRSVSVVRRHARPSLALIGLSWLILAGMSRVWESLATSLPAPYGVALGVLGNAYIASGLLAASMIFYFERAEHPPSAEPGASRAADPSALP